MRQVIVAGNWKLNGTLQSITDLISGIKAGLSEDNKAKVIVCPVSIHIGKVAKLIDGSAIELGAQNACDQLAGAFTGEVSVNMLKEYGVQHVILGHSERRAIYGETDELIAAKFKTVKDAGLTPILCVGETLEEREAGNTENVVATQLDAIINAHGVAALDGAIIAYEPVWAIGTGKTATPEQAQEIHQFIRQKLAGLDTSVADKIQILYGGSVNGGNAKELFAKPDIDGGLIGGASLKADEFLKICTAAN